MGLRWRVLLVSALSVACGTPSERETLPLATGGSAGSDGGGTSGALAGGSGGTSDDGGGAAGTPQAGGSGGSAEVQCKQKDSAPFPPVGFGQWPTPEGSALVTAVSPQQLKLDLGSDAGAAIFDWAGPSLDGAFVSGEAVEVGYANGWQFVQGSTNVAAVWRQGGFSLPSFIFPMPNNGPELSATFECCYSEMGACSYSPVSVLLFALLASKDGVTVKIPMKTTQTVAGWAITNVRFYEYPLDQHEGCIADADFQGIVTALGPVSGVL